MFKKSINHCPPIIGTITFILIVIITMPAAYANESGQEITGFGKLRFGDTLIKAKKTYKDLIPVQDSTLFREDPSFGADTKVFRRDPMAGPNGNLKARTIGGAIMQDVYYFFKNDRFIAIRGVNDYKLSPSQISIREELIRRLDNATKTNSRINTLSDEEINLAAVSFATYEQFKKLYLSTLSKYGAGVPKKENKAGSYESYAWKIRDVFMVMTYSDCLYHDKCGCWFWLDSLSVRSAELEF